jgi:hypothetical protein
MDLSLILNIAVGVFLGWVLIEIVKWALPQRRIDRAKAKMDALVAEAVLSGDVKALELFERETQEAKKRGEHVYDIDFADAIQRAKSHAGRQS